MPDARRPALFVAPTEALDEARAARLAAWLDRGEVARADRLRDRAARRDFLAAHALRRLALSRCFPGTRPEAWIIAAEGGSPAVAGRPDIGVSLSHARGLVAVAVARDGRVGVDAEAVDPRLATRAIAQTFCTPGELQALAAAGAGPALACEDFFTLWTVKESLLKATGTALATPPEAIELALAPLALRHAPAAFGPHWSFWTCRRGAYRISVAADMPDASLLPLACTLWDLAAGDPPPAQ